MTVTEAARNFSDLVNRTYYQGEETILYKGGRPMAKITPISEEEEKSRGPQRKPRTPSISKTASHSSKAKAKKPPKKGLKEEVESEPIVKKAPPPPNDNVVPHWDKAWV